MAKQRAQPQRRVLAQVHRAHRRSAGKAQQSGADQPGLLHHRANAIALHRVVGEARVAGASALLAEARLNGGGHALLEDELHGLGRFIRQPAGRWLADELGQQKDSHSC